MENKTHRAVNIENSDSGRLLTFDKLFVLFFFGSVMGVIIEGLFYVVAMPQGWQTHTVSVFLPFNILYGSGAILFYICSEKLQKYSRFLVALVISLIATAMELIVGVLLQESLGLQAWNYYWLKIQYRGIISLLFSFFWALLGLGFTFIKPLLDRVLAKCRGKALHAICIIICILFAADTFLGGAVIFRWSCRHRGMEPTNSFTRYIDENWNDEWACKRYDEWFFVPEYLEK